MNGKTATKALLIATACIEAPTGLLLLAVPSGVAAVLLGASVDSSVGRLLGRLAGVALISLGIACGLGSRDAQGQATVGLVAAMLFYNLVAATLLVSARFGAGLPGMGLLPVAALHAGLAVGCLFCLRASATVRKEFSREVPR